MNPTALLSRAGSWEWSWSLAATALILLLRWSLPADRRSRLHVPVVFVGMNAGLLGLSILLGPASRSGRALGVASVFFLILALLRLAFVVLFDALPVVRGRVPKIVQDVLIGLGYFVAVMGLFGASGVELSSLLTTSALLTAVVGLALQDTLGNVVSGLAIQVMRPYSVGDWVSLDGVPEHYGQVVEVNWRATRIVTNELVTLLIPNSNIAKATVANFSRPSPVVRRGLRVSVAYDVPPSRVEEIALPAIRSAPGVLSEPPPECVLSAFGDSGIEYWCRFFIDDFRRRDVIVGGVGARLYYDFLREGIEIPYPIRTVHLHERSDEQQTRDKERRQRRLAEHFLSIDFLAPLGKEVLMGLAQRVRTAVYGRGQAIVREGDEGTDLFLVERGQVAVTVDAGGKAQEVARLGPGEFFGEMSLMTGEARTASVIAATDLVCYRMDKPAFQVVLREMPALADQIAEILVMRRTALTAVRDERDEVRRRRAETAKQDLLGRIRGFFGMPS